MVRSCSGLTFTLLSLGSEMKTIFSARQRGNVWRQLWLWLAESQKELGLDISEEGLKQMADHLVMTEEDFKVAAEEERIRRHDVMGTFSIQILGRQSANIDSSRSRLWTSCPSRCWYHPLGCY